MRISSLLLRRIHKWIGLIIGLQFLIWTVSGTMMALLDMDEVAGGDAAAVAPAPLLPAGGPAWARVRQAVGDTPISGIALRPLLDRHVIELTTPAGVLLFDAADGRRISVDANLARRVAETSHPRRSPIRQVSQLDELTLPVREHELPIWRVDFADDENNIYYVSGSTGLLLERRNDTWRLWDFFWMLHNMDYANRTSFNHPLIIMMAVATMWLAITGLWLLFRTAWGPDLRALGKLKARARREAP